MKLLLQEPGSDEVAELWAAADWISSSRILYVEARAALAAARQQGRVRGQRLARVRERLEQLIAAVDAIELDLVLASATGELADRLSLCANDALHLASALTLANAQVVLTTWDRQLQQAARDVGLAVAPAG